ncbi:serine/threonine-protein kinase [Streptomyces sp. NPDC018584]|uniref:serine/threonine-protein kinase n=1 Tax=unclassified Streptomyces TaxID=2593676 RepID=UPI0037B4319B
MRETSPLRVGPYETLARLGSGGMGEVFLATPGPYEPDALVAVKAIRADVAGDAPFRARFRREISVARSVDSPCVAQVVAGDADAGQPWLATEYVAGPNLAEAVRRHGPLPVASVAVLGAGVARALAAVHAAGALHRDLKPANVLLGAAGPKLIDFGVARALGATTMTSTGLLVGTPGFMSPEHVAGGRHVVAASDVFCLGSVLAYAASGADPFGDGPVAAVLYRVARAEAELGGVPEPLRDVVACCLRPDPAQRPEPAELAALLAALRDDGDGDGDDQAADGGGGSLWPAAVLAAIAEVRRDVEQVCASGRPLLPLPARPAAAPAHPPTQVPTWSPAPAAASAQSSEVHGLPTMSSAPPPSARRGLGRRGAVAVVAAVAVAGAAVGALLALRGGGSGAGADGEGAGSAGATGSRTPGADRPSLSRAQFVARAGVDASGTADRSGLVPQYEEQRPKGWRPWRATFGHTPLKCAADTEAVVCLLTNGTYEARDAADGHRLWTSDGRSAEDRGTNGEAYLGPTGALFMPGDDQDPVVRGGTTVIAYKGRLQVRESRSGDVRRTVGAPAGKKVTGALLTDDHLIVSSEGEPGGPDGPLGATVQAFPREGRGGAPVWTHDLATRTLAKAEQGNYTAELAHGGLVYADSEDGVVAIDEKKGDRVGGAYDDGHCRTLMADTASGQLLCSQVIGDTGDFEDPTADPQTRVTRLDPRTLAVEGKFGFKAPPIGSDGYPGLDIVVSAVTPDAALAYDTTGGRLLVADPRNGRVTREERLSVVDYVIERPVSSGALVIGDRALTADNTTLRTVPLTKSGEVRRVKVPGAPGNRRPEPPQDTGTVLADLPKPPTVLPLGGIATIVYDQGTVVSVELPS